MWARWLELLLGLWLAASPWIFGASDTGTVALDLGAGAAVVVLALLSHRPELRRAHLLTLLVALALMLVGWLSGRGGETPPEQQNHLLLGMVLMMTAIVPSEALLPPPRWRRHAGIG